MKKRKPAELAPPPDDPLAKPIIAKHVAALSANLSPIRTAVSRYLKYPSHANANGVFEIGNRPWVAPFNYMITLYGGINKTLQREYCARFNIEIPEIYSRFLEELNGAFVFGISFYGIPPSMLSRGRLDRSVLQCHDFATGVLQWSGDYEVERDAFHFGGREFSFDENVGYFIDNNSKILCARKNGEILGNWSSLRSFLSDEIKTSEAVEESINPSQWK